ncbi:MAG: diaminopimelate epimerase [bacterium]
MIKLEFFKVCTSGNDFIVIDNRKKIFNIDHQENLVEMLCARHYAIGANGACFIEESETGDYMVRFFSSDGAESDFSVNGVRAAIRIASEKDIAGNTQYIETKAGMVKGEVAEEFISVEIPELKSLDIKYDIEIPHHFESKIVETSYVDSGFKHIVLKVEKTSTFDVKNIGSILSNHMKFQPGGVDVTFYDLIDGHNMNIVTYEVGVGGLVNASGNGTVSAFIVADSKKEINSPMIAHTWGGLLKVSKKGSTIVLEGEARIAYSGFLTADMLNFDIEKARKKHSLL